MNRTHLVVSIVFGLFCLSCGKSAEEARQELMKLNVEYSVDSFLNRVEQGDAVVVDLFLRSGMNPNAGGKDRETALWLAVDGGHELIVEKLIKAGADVNRKNPSGYGTPLTAAASKNEARIGRMLVNAGAQLKPEHAQSDPLSYAVSSGSADMVRFLLPLTKFEDKSEEFPVALRHRHNESVKEDREAVITAFLEDKDGIRLVRGEAGNEALIEASGEEQLDTVELLIGKGADVNATRKHGFRVETPLLAAAANSRLAAVRFLLEYGASTDLAGSRPALIAAIKKGNFAIVELLLDHGADPNWHNPPPPGLGCTLGPQSYTLEQLRKMGATPVQAESPDRPPVVGRSFGSDDYYRTPLVSAAEKGNPDIVRLLLQRGANPDITVCEGRTALSFAKDNETIKLLKERKP